MTIWTDDRGRDVADGTAGSTRARLALGTLCLAPFLGVFDTTAVVIALPAIQRDLGFSNGGVQWVLNGYTLALGGLLLLGGRLADVLGRRRVFVVGMGLFAAASLAAGLAVGPGMLIAARIVQGAAAAAMGPAALSLVSTARPEPGRRDTAIGIFGAMGGVGWIAGSMAGGALTEMMGWRWVLFAGVPVALVALLVAPAAVPESRDPDAPRRLDLAGAATATLGTTALIHAISGLPRGGWGSGGAVAFGAAGVALLAAFVVTERRADAALVPPGLFRVRATVVADAGMLLTGCAAIAQLYVLTLYFQDVLGRSPLEAGLLFVPAALAGIAVAPLAGVLVRRMGVRRVALLGFTVMAGGGVAMARLPVADGLPAVMAGVIALEVGFQLASVSLTIAATISQPECRQGVAAGLLQTTINLGNAIGLAAVAGVIAATTASTGTLVVGLRHGLLVAIGFIAAGFLLILVALPGRSNAR